MSKKRKLIWQIFPSFLIIILLSLTAETWYATRSFKDFFLENSEKELTTRALLLQDKFARALYTDDVDGARIDALCKTIGQRIHTRVTVLLETGSVIGDSFARVETMENHRNRPEIQRALAGEKGVAVRYSSTLDKTMMYIALPLYPNPPNPPNPGEGLAGPGGGKPTAVVRTAVSISDIDTKILTVRNSIFLAMALTILAAAIASLYVSRRITKPVEQMRKGAQEFSKGNLANRLPSADTEELSQLARAMNTMARELDKKIVDVENRSRELEAVHTSMQEGVIAIDSNEHIITINKAAAKVFDFAPETLKKRNILEVARNFEFQTFIQKALSTHEPMEDDIVIDRGEQHILTIHSTALYDTHQSRMGTLIIFHDITRIRRLETMHKDFAANVSHELKTPLTTIKGFIETLQQMMWDSSSQQGDSAEVTAFLKIIEKNVNRMIELINDLLALSRLERLQGTDIQFESHPLFSLVEGAVDLCRDHAKAKGIDISITCPEVICAMVDPILMEQAIFNLVDNAVKYTPEKTLVTIEVVQDDGQAKIVVRDSGPGIDKEHLPKLFNRFYRVDKGRSRNQGGTGLGLAIAKHIVQYHNGRIDVESRREAGTSFSIQIPVNPV